MRIEHIELMQTPKDWTASIDECEGSAHSASGYQYELTASYKRTGTTGTLPSRTDHNGLPNCYGNASVQPQTPSSTQTRTLDTTKREARVETKISSRIGYRTPYAREATHYKGLLCTNDKNRITGLPQTRPYLLHIQGIVLMGFRQHICKNIIITRAGIKFCKKLV